MAKFKANGAAVFQLPEQHGNNVSMGFCVCVCDNGCGIEKDDASNAEQIARCLNQDNAIKDLATWLLTQKTLHLNKERIELLKGIVK